MDLKQALEFLVTPNINPHTLARVITFYDIQNQSKFSIKQIKEKYNENTYFRQKNSLLAISKSQLL